MNTTNKTQFTARCRIYTPVSDERKTGDKSGRVFLSTAVHSVIRNDIHGIKMTAIKRGLYPLLHNITIVMKNGASIQTQSIFKRRTPLFLIQDASDNPLWTKEKPKLSSQDQRLQAVLRRHGEHLEEEDNASSS
jgi:hypothetical protein